MSAGPHGRYQVNAAGKKLVTVIPGDGVGPEIVGATRRVLEAAGAPIEWIERKAGAEVFKAGLASGVPADTVQSIRETRVVLKGPLETPVGFGEKSANVTLRKLFETYANIRPVREIPGVRTPYTGRGIDLVIVRENVEDVYAGIEYQETPGVAVALKLITRKGCEKVVRLAFELARAEGRKKVHCATKSNILKLTEGLLKRTFEDVAKEYPDIEANHIIIDNCAHQLVKAPEQFDVIVTTNMNGDIISDEGSALVGGLGFAPSANLGSEVAIFEAVHGSAPKYAGKNVINPTALLFTSVLLLRHLDEFAIAAKVESAVVATLAEGKVSTRDVVGDALAASTSAFADAVIQNLGKAPPPGWRSREYRPLKIPGSPPPLPPPKTRRTVGVDVFLESGLAAKALGEDLTRIAQGSSLVLHGISSRGTTVYPPTDAMTDVVDQWQARFLPASGHSEVDEPALLDLLRRISERHRWLSVERLQEFNGARGYTLPQGED
jgi:isocitrate dehydrogenase